MRSAALVDHAGNVLPDHQGRRQGQANNGRRGMPGRNKQGAKGDAENVCSERHLASVRRLRHRNGKPNRRYKVD